MTIKSLALVTTSSLALALTGPASQAWAQSAGAAPSQAADTAPKLEEIVVTGSRLSTGFVAPTPVAVLSDAQLTQMAPNSVADAISQLPELQGNRVTTNAGAVSAGGGLNGEALLSLRNLGANRTLILLDGNRLAQSNTTGSVDINTIPQALVQRVDVVTGGAAATYGSDAVAGVVNFILDKHFDGLKASLTGGITGYGDGENAHASIAYGTSFHGGRGHVIVAGDYFQQDGIKFPPTGRTWMDRAYGAYPNPAAGTAGATTTIVVPDVRFSNATFGGLITSVKGCVTASCNALKGMQFAPGGALIPFNPGTNVGTTFSSGGDGPFATNGLSPYQHRSSLFGHAEYDLNDDVTIFGEASYTRSHTVQDGAYPFENGSKFQFTIQNNNAFLPAPLAAIMAANPAATFTLGRYSSDFLPIINNGLNTSSRFATGIEGKFGGGWSYDANFMYTRSIQNFDQTDTINRNLYAAADAVRVNGQIVCRSTSLGFDPGCVPINLFGSGAPSPAAVNYVEAYDRGDSVFHQTAFNANLRGNLGDTFAFGAGPISTAIGMAYRRDDVNRVVDPLSATYTSCANLRGCPVALDGLYGGYQSYNPGPLAGAISATEGYAELGVPLLADKTLIKLFSADLAGRITGYSTSGATYSWKVGANWSVNDDLRLRITRSQDIRAPSLTDLYSAGTSATNTALYPASTPTFKGVPTAIPTSSITLGNPDLLPEKAHTTTVGAIFSPSAITGLQASVDYYNINISGALGTAGQQNIINNCYLGLTSYCSYITYNNNLPITTTTQLVPPGSGSAPVAGVTVKNFTLNINTQSTSGLDLELAYATPFLDGTLTARALGNYLLTAYDSSNAPTASKLVGSNGGSWPRWTGNMSLQYDTDKFGVFVQERFISAGKSNPNLVQGVDININEVPLITYTALTLTYKFDAAYNTHNELFVSVTNLFDQDPPITVTGSSSFENPTNFSLYDILGRRFTVGIRMKM